MVKVKNEKWRMNVNEAFEALLSGIVSAMQEARRRHKAATQQGDLTAMVAEHERVESLLAAREQLEALRDSWPALVGEGEPGEVPGPTYRGARAARGAKPLPTFSDALAVVRERLWQTPHFHMSPFDADMARIPRPLPKRFTEALCYAA